MPIELENHGSRWWSLCHFESCPEILSKEICLYLIKNPAFQIQRNTENIV